ncbi:MAG TPA: patatin-like phospholipase family protein, partial [Isosphaeraceae bacterium]|nr:patatin-like phospholipase family protein [Isosphaeraceae bacterium]
MSDALPSPGPDVPFEIGLVMAGAVSAGAYTAGVLDFLIAALDEWQQAKDHARAHPDQPGSADCPIHEVKLRVMAGASAGGITAGLAAGLLGMRFESVTALPQNNRPVTPANNNLYRSWVNAIDIDPLLGLKDLEADSNLPVQSVLDSSILVEIADTAFNFERPEDRASRPYVSDPLDVLFSVTNLRGVPYAPAFQNWPKVQQYEMMLHADNMHFVLSKSSPAPQNGTFWLKPYDFENSATWGVLQHSALATAAFPVGLAPRLLRRPPAQYSFREWLFAGPHNAHGVHYCEYWKAIPPYWASIEKKAKADPNFQYEFLCVDGGTTNNEPLDLARIVLNGPLGIEARDGEKATKAVIMILPFPNAAPYPVDYDGRTNLFHLLFTTFSSLIAQARFKPEELTLANNPDVYSRFLIVPRRGFLPDGSLQPYTIACGSLRGFGGFLSRKFREHDYQLGRRNCQWFLKQYFALPSEGEHRNRLFDHWTPAARAKHQIDAVVKREPDAPAANATAGGEHFLPIIPLLGKAAEPVLEPLWPTFTE